MFCFPHRWWRSISPRKHQSVQMCLSGESLASVKWEGKKDPEKDFLGPWAGGCWLRPYAQTWLTSWKAVPLFKNAWLVVWTAQLRKSLTKQGKPRVPRASTGRPGACSIHQENWLQYQAFIRPMVGCDFFTQKPNGDVLTSCNFNW